MMKIFNEVIILKYNLKLEYIKMNYIKIRRINVFSDNKYIFALSYDEYYNKISVSDNIDLEEAKKEIYDYIIDLHRKILHKYIPDKNIHKELKLEDFFKMINKEERTNKVEPLSK